MSAATTLDNGGSPVKVKKHDWGTFFAGLAVGIVGIVVMVLPGATLLTLATLAGVLLLIAGIAEIVGYFAYRGSGFASGWQVAGGICNLVLAAVFLANPLLTAVMLPWIAGIAIACYGIFSIIAGVQTRSYLPGVWGWFVASGIISLLCAILFWVYPESFVIFLGVFLVFRGITMMVFGATTRYVEIDTDDIVE